MSEWTGEAPKAIDALRHPTVAELLTRQIIAIVGQVPDLGWDVKVYKAVEAAFQYADQELEIWRREGVDRLTKQIPLRVFVCARCGKDLEDEGIK